MAYFRGRKLKGKDLKIGRDYRGLLVKDDGRTKDLNKQPRTGSVKDDEDEEVEEVKDLHEVGSFDNIILWGHEELVEVDDAFVKGLGEWIGFAEIVWPLSQRNALLIRHS